MKKTSLPLFIFILPLIVLISSFLFRAAAGPFWQYGDPCYNYFFNALEIIQGQVPTDITHPGTPLQVLIALIIRILNLGQSPIQTVNHALIGSEFYLRAVFIFLATCSFLSSAFLAAYVYAKTNDKWAALLTQLPTLAFLIMPSFDNGSFPVLPVTANVSAEPFFIIIMNLFNLFLLKLYFAKNKNEELRSVLLLAFICAVGLASKLNFAFILLSALILVPLERKFVFLIVCAVSFIFCTLPILGKYPQLFAWATDIVSHSSRYGTGGSQFIDWKSFLFNFHLMMHIDWFFVLSALGWWLWSSVRIGKEHKDRNIWFIWVLSFCCLLHIMATAKHFSFHYLLPALGLFSPLFVLFYLKQKQYKILKPLTGIFILIFTSSCIFYMVPYYKKLQALTDDIRHFNATLNAKYPQCTIIPSTTGDIDFFLNRQEALQRANGTAFRVEGDDLFHLYPRSYYFFSEEVTSPDNNESYGIWNFKQRVLADDIIPTCPCAIFTKYTSDFSLYPYQVHLLEQSKYLSAFLLLNSTEKAANILFTQSMDALSKGEYRQALILGLKSRELNYQPRGQLEYILTRLILLNQKQ